MGTNSTCITANSHLMLCKTGGWLALHHSIAVLCNANFNSVLYVIWASIIHLILPAKTVHNDNSSTTEVFSLSQVFPIIIFFISLIVIIIYHTSEKCISCALIGQFGSEGQVLFTSEQPKRQNRALRPKFPIPLSGILR